MKYVLSVGINKYRKSVFGSIDLEQCVNDSNRFNNKIQCNELCQLLDEQATKSEIISNLKYYASICKSGDTFIYFQSSHGTDHKNPKGEVMTGRVTHDNVLWDFEFLNILSLFPKGCNVVTLSDCCYAESNSREVLPFGYKVKSVKTTLVPTEGSTSKVRSNCYFIAACKFDSVSLETDNGGMFTNALLNSLATPTWKTLIKQIKKETSGNQTPVIECIKTTNKLNLPHLL